MTTKEEIVEEVADVIEETLDVIENTQQVVKNNPKLLLLVAALSSGGGAAIAYFIAKRKLKAHYEEVAEAEIALARKRYSDRAAIVLDEKPETPGELVRNVVQAEREGAVAQLKTVIEHHNYAQPSADEVDQANRRLEGVTGQEVEVEPEVAEVPAESVSIFTDPADPWDYDDEMAKRTEEAPYIIHRDEYNGNETEYNQTTLTFYDEDGVLTDERDVPIDDIDGTVGEDNMDRFGYGSLDQNIVYIRNDRLELDAEVIRANGSYSKLVLGIKHEDEPRRRRPSRLGRDDE